MARTLDIHRSRSSARAAAGARELDRLAIVHVLSSLGMGGQERVALDLAAGQAERRHRIWVVSLDARAEGPLADAFHDRGVGVAHLPKRTRIDPSLPARLFSLLRRHRVDVVHTHNPQPLIYAAAPARAAGAAVVHTKHGVNPAPARQRWMRRASASLTSAFVAVADHTAEVARSGRECPRSRLRVVPNGIDLSRFAPDPAARADIRAELGIPDSAHVVGTVGRLFVEKGHTRLLDALAGLLSSGSHVVIVGAGPEDDNLKAHARGLPSPGSVHLLGARRDVPRILTAFDTFALTSLREGLPLVVPEAMAAGLPVVATAVGGLPKVVAHGETGFLVEDGDARALRRRLEQLAADPSLARRLGARGRERALAEFSADAMVARYMEIYRAAVGHREPRARAP